MIKLITIATSLNTRETGNVENKLKVLENETDCDIMP
jgi:hypothetical protein